MGDLFLFTFFAPPSLMMTAAVDTISSSCPPAHSTLRSSDYVAPISLAKDDHYHTTRTRTKTHARTTTTMMDTRNDDDRFYRSRLFAISL